MIVINLWFFRLIGLDTFWAVISENDWRRLSLCVFFSYTHSVHVYDVYFSFFSCYHHTTATFFWHISYILFSW